MMTVYWPTDVPMTNTGQIVVQPVFSRTARQLQSGRKEVRRFTSGEPYEMSVTLMMTPEQYDTFIAWYEDDCDMGTVKFQAFWAEDLGFSSDVEMRILNYPKRRDRKLHFSVPLKLLVFA